MASCLNYPQNIVLNVFHDPACPETGVEVEVGFEREVAIQVQAAAAVAEIFEAVGAIEDLEIFSANDDVLVHGRWGNSPGIGFDGEMRVNQPWSSVSLRHKGGGSSS